ncbi:hypothetical protein lbkm_0753 [Lachnospiraceae bacterium KM106-2]|nr:hypothetical protein lbkm_0753 [Lachnospiraceae bacterium KM106-2]
MLYTVMPLERVYHSYDTKDEKEEMMEFSLEHGRIIAKRCEDHYEVERILSTDMSDYLREDYMPGALLQREKSENTFEDNTSFPCI